jgi:hypothetical protein
MESDRERKGKKGDTPHSSGTPSTSSAEVVEVFTWDPRAMMPGFLFLLRNRLELRKENGSHSFWAILACPQCGIVGLITELQYLGQDSVVCGSTGCSAHFFINDRTHFEYLPAH